MSRSTDMFYKYEDSNMENYNDDTTPYVCAPDIDAGLSELQITTSKLF